MQGGLEEFQVFIEGAEEFVDPSGDSYGLFHQVWQAFGSAARFRLRQ